MKSLLIASLALAGCLPSLPNQPIESYELDGTWCNTAPNRTCLTVDQSSYPSHYTWQQGTCTEHGILTGGLEFTPATDSRLCLAPEYDLYSAGAQWTATGITIDVDTATSEARSWGDSSQAHYRLNWQPQ